MDTYRKLWRILCGVLVALGVGIGVLVLPVEAWILLGLLAIVGALTALVGRDDAQSPATGRSSSVKYLVGRLLTLFALVTAVIAFTVVLHLQVLLLMALVGVTAPRLVERFIGTGRYRMGYHPPSLRISTRALCLEWRASYVALNQAQSSVARLRIVMARQRYLDELERRDPDGLRAWLESTASAGGDPARFLSTPDNPEP